MALAPRCRAAMAEAPCQTCVQGLPGPASCGACVGNAWLQYVARRRGRCPEQERPRPSRLRVFAKRVGNAQGMGEIAAITPRQQWKIDPVIGRAGATGRSGSQSISRSTRLPAAFLRAKRNAAFLSGAACLVCWPRPQACGPQALGACLLTGRVASSAAARRAVPFPFPNFHQPVRATRGARIKTTVRCTCAGAGSLHPAHGGGDRFLKGEAPAEVPDTARRAGIRNSG
jgi:hypothetical protein